ncbi:MAG: aminoglycoside phosphotransferase family protein, partial [Parachlamydiales bacterium]|nr:aminoglycoside phosphotransferase family protein [Parachlamydiales bacterium]
HEDAISSNVYKLDFSKNGKSLILKILFSKLKFSREFFYLNKLKNIFPVPKIENFFEPTIENKGAILIEYIDGSILKASELSDDLSYQMGQVLAKLHSIPVDFVEDFSKTDPKNIDLKKKVVDYLNESLLECKGYVEDSLLEKCERFVLKELEFIKSLAGPCIVHRDFRPGNVIFKNNSFKAVIDFENAMISYAEEDFGSMQALVWNKYPNTKQSFLKGYSTIKTVPDLDNVMPILTVVKALGAIGFTIVRKTYKNKHKLIFKNNIDLLNNFFK